MIKVIDNVLDEPLFKFITDLVISNNSKFPWYLVKDINNINKFPNGIQTIQLSHHLFVNKKEYNKDYSLADKSPHTKFIHKLIIPVLEKNKIYGDIVRSKFNLLFPHPKINSNLDHNVTHIDLDGPHYSILLYLNDSDGDTIFFKDKGNIELKRVTPKSNRMVISNGLYHTSTNPIKFSFRAVLNMVVRKNNEI
tara:strand:+ start:200 stop:781 length:582 start_codon:yes stop_codon:yes gene_type:complete